jgi:hypothetical protein
VVEEAPPRREPVADTTDFAAIGIQRRLGMV